MKSRILGASLLVAGTSIGAAMLALPLSSALTGFKWSLFILCVSWFFMYSTGLCILEVESAFKSKSSSFIFLAEETLGSWGARFTALSFFCLLYSLLAAYITGGGDVVEAYLNRLAGHKLPGFAGILSWTALFAVIIYLGVAIGDFVNRILMLCLFVLYAILAFALGSHIDTANLSHSNISEMWLAIPVVFTAHAYHIVIPSIYHYLDEDIKDTKRALIYGSLIPLVLYMIWEYVVFGVLPLTGEPSLSGVMQSGHTTSGLTQAFSTIAGSDFLGSVSQGFVFFAIASSFLGVSLGLFDMIKDAALKWNLHLTKLSQVFLTFVPGLVYGVLYPGGFIKALGYAGIFVALLHGFLPILMVLGKRYHRKLESRYMVPGGKLFLGLLLLFFLLVIVTDIIYV